MIRNKTRNRTCERIDGAAAGLLLAYAVVIGLFILWFYPIARAHYGFNPGLAAYQPPPATVIYDHGTPVRLGAGWHAPPPVEIQSRPAQPRTTATSTGAPPAIRALVSTGVPASAGLPAAADAFASTEPATAAPSRHEHAVKARRPTHSRSSAPPRERQSRTRERSGPSQTYASTYPGYSGDHPF
jgi:hypothetical protein